MNNITRIFSEIDSKIQELLECAYKDFMGLNNSFKRIAKDSRQFIGNSKTILTSINDICNNANYKKFKQLEDALLDSLKPNYQITEIGHNLHHIIDYFNNLNVLFKNLNQDLLTLKFLLANYQISESANTSEADLYNAKIEKYINIINSSRRTENSNFLKMGEILSHTVQIVDEINGLNHPLNEAYNVIQIGTEILSNKKQYIDEQQVAINAQTKIINDSIASIITQLQYHDIIQQKVEHIRQSHQEIISNANIAEDDNLAQENLLSEIKEMANIQSAILVKANQEYQFAIENITAQMKSICNRTNSISAISYEQVNIKVGNMNMESQHLYNRICQTCTTVQNLFKTENRTFSNLTQLINEIYEINTNLHKQNNYYLNQIADFQFTNPNNYISQQIREVLIDIETICNKAEGFCNNIDSSIAHIHKISNNFYDSQHNILLGKNFRKAIIDIYISIIGNVEQDFTSILGVYESNKKINQNISINVNNAINHISYYKVFENKIFEIIEMLNDVFQEIKGQTSTEKLENIRKLYTMQSEHTIHTNIVEGIQDENNDESTGDVELF